MNAVNIILTGDTMVFCFVLFFWSLFLNFEYFFLLVPLASNPVNGVGFLLWSGSGGEVVSYLLESKNTM